MIVGEYLPALAQSGEQDRIRQRADEIEREMSKSAVERLADTRKKIAEDLAQTELRKEPGDVSVSDPARIPNGEFDLNHYNKGIATT